VGESYTKQATGREFMWDVDQGVRRIRGVAPGLPIPAAQFGRLMAICRTLDREPRAAGLIGLTLER